MNVLHLGGQENLFSALHFSVIVQEVEPKLHIYVGNIDMEGTVSYILYDLDTQ